MRWHWSKACSEAFRTAKEKIVSPNILVHYDPGRPLTLAADASAYGIGPIISHTMEDGTERPMAFASRTLLLSEKNYSQIEKEALCIILEFQVPCLSLRTLIYTNYDHKPLTSIFGPKKGVPTIAAARLQRWALKLSAYSYCITSGFAVPTNIRMLTVYLASLSTTSLVLVILLNLQFLTCSNFIASL